MSEWLRYRQPRVNATRARSGVSKPGLESVARVLYSGVKEDKYLGDSFCNAKQLCHSIHDAHDATSVYLAIGRASLLEGRLFSTLRGSMLQSQSQSVRPVHRSIENLNTKLDIGVLP